MCTVYRDFAQFYLSPHIKEPTFTGKTPMASSRKLLPSPELGPLKMLSPFASIRKITPLIKTKQEAISMLNIIAGKKDKTKARMTNSNKPEDSKNSKPDCAVDFKNKKRVCFLKSSEPTVITNSPLISTEGIHRLEGKTLKRRIEDGGKTIVICGCGNECQEDEETCKKCFEKLKETVTRGYLYEKSDKRTLNRYWYILTGTQIYRYKAKTDTENNGMYLLVGCFITQGDKEQAQKTVNIFPITIHFGTRKLTLYTIKKEDQQKWVTALKSAIGYSDLTDYYTLGKELGAGKYGVVGLATHKLTGQDVAVKMLKKAKLSIEELALAKREIEIMKVCQHPNIARILDTFENLQCIYIVIEVLNGGDFFEYLEKREFKITESRARSLIHSLATALFYLNSYGIIHRDIKLENILMTDDSEISEPKLIDFGLSKMIGPNEFCTEPFGTIGYAAPEILLGQPYDKSIDIWSLGVVLFITLTGRTPFDAESDAGLAR